MLSILIPTYNYNIALLVNELFLQCELIPNLNFEILVYDDGSQLYHSENSKINNLKNCSYTILEKNIGRSAIRNLLAKNAQYQNLLFLDADVRVVSTNFISVYLQQIQEHTNYQIVYGGIIYQFERPNDNQLLRWSYGNNREALKAEIRNQNMHLSFLTLNFLIKKEVFSKVSFNEKIPNLRYEDLLFSYNLMQKNIEIKHIDNLVIHNGIETSHLFLEKTNSSLHGLKYLLDHNFIHSDYAKISSVYTKMKKGNQLNVMRFFFNCTQKLMIKNLLGKKPSLFIYDLYRLGYLCSIKP